MENQSIVPQERVPVVQIGAASDAATTPAIAFDDERALYLFTAHRALYWSQSIKTLRAHKGTAPGVLPNASNYFAIERDREGHIIVHNIHSNGMRTGVDVSAGNREKMLSSLGINPHGIVVPAKPNAPAEPLPQTETMDFGEPGPRGPVGPPHQTMELPAERPLLLALMFGKDEPLDLYVYQAVTVVKTVVACASHRFIVDYDADGAWQAALRDAQTLFEAVGYAAVDAWKWHENGGKSFRRVGYFEAEDGEFAQFTFAADIIAPPGPPSRKLSKPQVEAILDSLMTGGALDAVKTMREIAPAFFADVDAKTVSSGNSSFDAFLQTQDGNVRQAFEDGTYGDIPQKEKG